MINNVYYRPLGLLPLGPFLLEKSKIFSIKEDFDLIWRNMDRLSILNSNFVDISGVNDLCIKLELKKSVRGWW